MLSVVPHVDITYSDGGSESIFVAVESLESDRAVRVRFSLIDHVGLVVRELSASSLPANNRAVIWRCMKKVDSGKPDYDLVDGLMKPCGTLFVTTEVNGYSILVGWDELSDAEAITTSSGSSWLRNKGTFDPAPITQSAGRTTPVAQLEYVDDEPSHGAGRRGGVSQLQSQSISVPGDFGLDKLSSLLSSIMSDDRIETAESDSSDTRPSSTKSHGYSDEFGLF